MFNQFLLVALITSTLLSAQDSMKILGDKHGTDKIHKHSYHKIYEDILAPLRDDTFHMLEIGVLYGESLRMWKEYFPLAQVHGIDLRLQTEPEERIHLYQGNIRDLKFLSSVLQTIGEPLQFILDDASHIPEDQKDSFLYLFEHALASGGIYIIEDVETSYWRLAPPFNVGFQHKRNIVEFFKKIPDLLNQEYSNEKDHGRINKTIPTPKMRHLLRSIKSITFARNCIIIRKK